MSENKSFASRVAVSFLYSGVGNLLAKLAFIGAIFVVLKLISVEDFGVANIVLAIFAITESVNELGLGVALVQRKDIDRDEIDSLFWLSFGISVTIYALVFLCAPLISWFYEEPSLTALVRVYGLVLILFSLYFIPRNLMVKEMSFGQLALIDVFSLLTSSALMILLALWDYGPWSIIIGDLANRSGQFILCQLLRPYFPRFVLRFHRVRDMVSFGLYATGSRLLYNFYINADYLIVGKVFGAEALGIYTLAYRLISDPVKALANIINQVAYPAFARLQNQRERLRKYFFVIARAALSLIGVLLVIVAVYVDWGLTALDYEKWLEAVPIARIFAVTGLIRCVSPLIPQLLNAVGQARKSFYYSVATAVFMPMAFLVGAQFSLMGVAWAWSLAYPAVVMILIVIGASVLEISFFAFIFRLFAGLRVLIPAAILALALRFGLDGLYETHPQSVTLAAVLLTLSAGGLLAVYLEWDTIQVIRKKKSE